MRCKPPPAAAGAGAPRGIRNHGKNTRHAYACTHPNGRADPSCAAWRTGWRHLCLTGGANPEDGLQNMTGRAQSREQASLDDHPRHRVFGDRSKSPGMSGPQGSTPPHRTMRVPPLLFRKRTDNKFLVPTPGANCDDSRRNLQSAERRSCFWGVPRRPGLCRGQIRKVQKRDGEAGQEGSQRRPTQLSMPASRPGCWQPRPARWPRGGLQTT